MTLAIMAAGMGSRYGGLKQIEPVDEAGNFILDYSIYDAIRAGFDKVVFIIKEENYEIFRDTVGKRIEDKIKVEYVFQTLDILPEGYSVPEGRIRPWGTGHAVLSTKDVITDNFAVINADDFYGRDGFKVLAEFLKNDKSENKYAMVGYKVSNTLTENGYVKRGVCKVKDDGSLEGLVECAIDKKDGKLIATPLQSDEEAFEIGENVPVSMNLWGFKPSMFENMMKDFAKFLDDNKDDLINCEYFLPAFVSKEIEEGHVSVDILKTSAIWRGITYKEDKEDVINSIKALVNAGEYPVGLWK